MTKEELALSLNGRLYGQEINAEEAKQAKAAGLVVLYGYSDDGVELAGAIDDEIGAWNGTTLRVTKQGLLPEWDNIDHKDEAACAKYFEQRDMAQWLIKCRWCADPDGPAWAFETTIPHATFEVMEDGDVFCRGIVFSMANL